MSFCPRLRQLWICSHIFGIALGCGTYVTWLNFFEGTESVERDVSGRIFRGAKE